MNVNILIRSNRGGDVKCIQCQHIVYIGAKHLQAHGPICRKCLKQISHKQKKNSNRKQTRDRASYLKRKYSLSLEGKLKIKISQFCTPEPSFTVDELLLKIGPEPKCYLTGRPIDLEDSSSYHLDHIVPISRGGSSSIDNCQIACAIANKSKTNLMLDEYYDLCKEVLKNANLL